MVSKPRFINSQIEEINIFEQNLLFKSQKYENNQSIQKPIAFQQNS